MLAITKRNLKIFFRDKVAVFFSLLSIFIVIGLYVFFLEESMVQNLGEIEGAQLLMDTWVMAGILSITPITTTMGAFSIMVNDRYNKILKDFSVAPIKRWQLVGGYVLSSFTIGFVMSLTTFILTQIYLVSSGGNLLSGWNTLKVISTIALTVLTSSAMTFFIVSLLKSQSAFSTVSTVIGSILGFLTGIYIPIGALPDAVQTIIRVFPIAHASSLLRQIFMMEPMAVTFANAPVDIVDDFKLQMGIVYEFRDYRISSIESLIILVITILVFFSLSVLNFSRKNNEIV